MTQTENEGGNFVAKRNSLDMTQGPVLRKLLVFAFPLMFSAIVNTFYHMADKVIAGQFIGPNAMAAVGASGPLLNLIINFFVGVGAGVAVLCGNYIGSRNQKAVRECVYTAPIVGLLFGLMVTVIGLVFDGPMLRATGTPNELFSDALLYMNIRMSCAPLELCNNFCIGVLTAHGDTKRITVSGLISGLVNLVGNVVFVTVIPLGIAGIALSTNLSILTGLIIKIVIFFSPKDNYKLKLSEMKLHWVHAKKMIAIGLPSGLNNVVFNISNVLLQSSVNSFGSVVMAGNSAADTVAEFVWAFPSQLAAACSCAAAQCFGAHKIRRIDEVMKKGIFSNTVAVLLSCALVTVFANPVMNLFVEDPAVATAGIPKLMFCVWGYAIYGISLIYAGALRGIQKTVFPMVINIGAICLPRVLWVWFVFPSFHTATMLYLIYPLSWTFSAVLMAIAYYRARRNLLAIHAA